MRFQFEIKIGETVFQISDEAANPAEFFQKVAFYQELPENGPNGEIDLKLCYRTPQGYEYYSIISESAGQEFKLGQLKDEKGQLFPKGWEPWIRGSHQEHEEDQEAPPPRQNGKTQPTGKNGQSNQGAKPAQSTAKITHQDFWAYQRGQKINRDTAVEIAAQHTDAEGVTNWAKALHALQEIG